ncbi:unnamed protein product [Echinostoma caproni]|uniref:PDZ domain-containing protein n=1 Tax=Echinostoma caproni TaxID=27848 RepID=A0A183A701_9TREM|nr:unnamed protein product [Echinostoma caproni]
MLHTDWTEVEVIELLVDSTTGLGFGMCGSKSTGIIVRHIHPGGAAETDGRLRLGDHIVCVQDFNVRGFGPDQVATVLRHTISANLLAASMNPDVTDESASHIDLFEVKSNRGEIDWPIRTEPLSDSSAVPPLNQPRRPTDVSTESPVVQQTDETEQSVVEAIVHAVPIRFIVARPVQGIPQELNEEYEYQQRLINEHQVYGTVRVWNTPASSVLCSRTAKERTKLSFIGFVQPGEDGDTFSRHGQRSTKSGLAIKRSRVPPTFDTIRYLLVVERVAKSYLCFRLGTHYYAINVDFNPNIDVPDCIK